MAARVIHFGWDDCYRVQVLRSVGYEVHEATSLDALGLDLEQDSLVDAVVVSEDQPVTTEKAADLVRSKSRAPLILFRHSQRELDESKFDRVHSWFVTPAFWLADVAELIAASRACRQAGGPSQEGSEVRACLNSGC